MATDGVAVIYQPGTGTNVDVHTVTTTAGSGLVRPRTSISDPTADTDAAVDSNGLHVTNPSQVAATGTAVAAAAAAAALKSTAGALFAIVISTQGTAAVTLTDGSGGKVIAVIPANQPVGDLPLYGGLRPFATGLYANTGAGSPAFTVFTNP